MTDNISVSTASQLHEPELDGEMSWDLDAREEVADDFGHLFNQLPRAVVKPASPADVASAVRWAGERGLPVAARGQGHSVFGRAQAAGGITIDMRCLDTVHHVGQDHVVVDGGTTWASVVAAAARHGLTPPVHTNYLDMSVGGTLSAGGIGGTTHRYGMQTDNVLAMDVVTGDGRQLTCSPTQNADLFDAVRGGLSQVGIITRATLRLVPAHGHARLYLLHYQDLRTFTADQRRVLTEERADHLQGTILPDESGGWTYVLEAATEFTPGSTDQGGPDDGRMLAGLSDERDAAEIEDMPMETFLNRLVPLEKHLRSTGEWSNPHPWWLSFLPSSNVDDVVAEVLDRLTAADLGEWGRGILYPIATTRIATPLLRLPGEDVVFPFNLLRFAPADRGVAERMVDDNRVLYERVRQAGGTLYPVSAFSLIQADWKNHFGPRWQDIVDAKKRYDPRHVLTPGQEMF